MFFDRQIGVKEPLLRVPGNRHEGDPLIHVAEVGIEPQLELARNLAFLFPKLSGERPENPVIDLVVHIVDVDLHHALAQSFALGLEARDRRIMIVFHVSEALAKRVSEPAEHGLRHGDSFEHGGELLDQHFLADVGLAALPLEVAAPVIDVFLLLDVADEQAAAVVALDHSGEQEVALNPTDARRVAAVEHALDPFPELDRDQGLV